MAPIDRAASLAVSGLERQFDRFERSAAQIAELGAASDRADSVDISSPASGGGSELASVGSASIEGALVDVRISKYLAIANMKVLKTADEMSQAAEDIVR